MKVIMPGASGGNSADQRRFSQRRIVDAAEQTANGSWLRREFATWNM
jgi:hypothetical protein